MGLYIRCCYYKFDKNNSITCEDVIRQFDSKEDKKTWIKKYCEKDWEKCPHADKLNKLYERMDKENMSEKDKKTVLEMQQLESANHEIMNLKKKLGRAKNKNQQLERDCKAANHLASVKYKQLKVSQAKISSLEMMCGYLVDKLGITEIVTKDITEFYGKYAVNWKSEDGKIIMEKVGR